MSIGLVCIISYLSLRSIVNLKYRKTYIITPPNFVDAFAGEREGSGGIQEVNVFCPPVLALGLSIGELARVGVDGD